MNDKEYYDELQYWEQRAEDALDSFDYAETDDEVEYCMANYYEARNMVSMLSDTAYLNSQDNGSF